MYIIVLVLRTFECPLLFLVDLLECKMHPKCTIQTNQDVPESPYFQDDRKFLCVSPISYVIRNKNEYEICAFNSNKHRLKSREILEQENILDRIFD